MNSSASSTPSSLLRPASLVTNLNSFLIAFIFALTMPTLSVYVAKHLNSSPFEVGIFFVAVSLASVVYAQLLGHYSDKLHDRRRLIAMGMLAGGLACVLFSRLDDYLLALLTGVTLYSFAFASIAQIFAHARDYANENLASNRAVIFNSIIRASAAFAWVSGPPVGYLMLDALGFTQHYFYTGIAFAAVGAGAWLCLPRTRNIPPSHVPPIENKNTMLVLAIVAFSLLYGCNYSYMIALPLYLNEHLNIDIAYAGWIMGTAAALEIPVMILGGWLGSRFALLPLMRIGAAAALALYAGVWVADALWQLFVLQAFNAVFIGFIAGLGMSWFQDMLPGKAGAASALYMNCTNIGNVLGALIIAVFAEVFSYRDVFAVNAIAACLAIVFISAAHRRR